jgi:NSS family neurotransmitter:Na+ symporter
VGFILASAGSAVGLGAIWRFPYVAASQGGGAFLFLFIFFSLTLGLALLVAETSIGRLTQKGAVSAFSSLGGSAWKSLGYLSLLAGFIVYSFYGIVGGWTLMYLFKAISSNLLTDNVKQLEHDFGAYVSNGALLITTQGLYILLTLSVIIGGVQKGIERASKFLMPALFVIMLILIVRSLTLDGALEGVIQFIKPNWNKITHDTVLEALGLAIFSLSLGTGGMLAYGSYVDKKVDLLHSVKWVTLLSVMVCLLSGLMILPAVSAYHLEPKESVGLTFMTMPIIFASMPMGYMFSVIFFFLLVVAALTSSMNMLELLVVFATEELGVSRKVAAVVMSILVFATGVPAALSFGVWSHIHWFGTSKIIFEFMADAASNIMMPLSCMGTAIFSGFFVWKKLRSELSPKHPVQVQFIRLLCMIAPVIIAMIMYNKII